MQALALAQIKTLIECAYLTAVFNEVCHLPCIASPHQRIATRGIAKPSHKNTNQCLYGYAVSLLS